MELEALLASVQDEVEMKDKAILELAEMLQVIISLINNLIKNPGKEFEGLEE